MKNVIFISPNFPENYWQFCRALHSNGMNVLGIGDCPYDDLLPGLKEALTEYYKVNSLENYDEVFRAVAFLSFKYGKIDWLESNNEYWLEQDARLRADFNIRSGFQPSDIPRIKYKSKMKRYYEKAGIPVARYALATSLKKSLDFAKKVGYPIIAKPDNGVGASHTYKLSNEDELKEFYESKEDNIPYILEEFIDGVITSYDAIVDSGGTPIFEAGNITPISIMDIVNYGENCRFYIVKDLPEDVIDIGRRTLESFRVKSRFIHFEYFRLLSDHKGLGKKGDLMALEVNMRPSGGVTPDMINFARETDVYQIWADMIAFDKSSQSVGAHHFVGFAGLRDGYDFVLKDEDVRKKYADHLKMAQRVPEALSGAMGNMLYLGSFDTQEELDSFYEDITRVNAAGKPD